MIALLNIFWPCVVNVDMSVYKRFLQLSVTKLDVLTANPPIFSNMWRLAFLHNTMSTWYSNAHTTNPTCAQSALRVLPCTRVISCACAHNQL